MRVLLLNTSFRAEGPNNTFLEIARRARDMEIEICAGALTGRGAMEAAYRRIDVPTVYFGKPGPSLFTMARRVGRFLADRKIDLLHCQLLRGEVVGALSALNVPRTAVVCTVQNEDPYRVLRKNPLKALLSRWALGHADRVVVVSRALGLFVEKYQGVHPENVEVIPNAIDPARFRTRWALPIPKDFPKEKRIIGCVGRLATQKGQRYLIEAFRRCATQLDGAELMILGSGPHEKALKRRAGSGPLAARIRFAGWRDSVEQYIPFFDLYVQPSLWEGMPFATMEAMASGVPVVASQVGGLSELIRDGKDGILIPPRDVTALADSMVRIMTDDHLKAALSRAGRRRIHTEYRADIMTSAYAQLYMGLSDKHRQQ